MSYLPSENRILFLPFFFFFIRQSLSRDLFALNYDLREKKNSFSKASSSLPQNCCPKQP